MGQQRRAVKRKPAGSADRARADVPLLAPERIGPLDRPALVLAAMVLAYIATYSILAGILFRYYLYTDFDLAIFTQAVDGLLHGRLFSSIRGMAWLGDHSSLILFLITPLYAVIRHPVTLLVVQVTAQALGAVPMFALARREIGHTGLALAFAGVYLLQPALGYSALFEFHPELLATAPLLAAFYYLRCGRLRPTLLWAGVALLCREDVVLVVSMMALYTLTRRRPGRGRLALALAAAAAASALVTWGVLRPAFFTGQADYVQIYRQWGDTLGAAAMNMLRDPIRVAVNLFSSPGQVRDTLVKQQFHLTLFLPLGLLSLFSPLTLALALPVFMEHLLSWRAAQHTILCQYTALQVPFVSAAAVIGTRNLLAAFAGGTTARRPSGTAAAPRTAHGTPGIARPATIAMIWALTASVGCQLWFGPLLSSGRFFITGTRGRHLPTGEERALARDRDDMLARVPRRGAVVASFEYLSHLAARDSVHSLHHVITGTYTFSTLPYPEPAGVSALIADLAAPNIVGAVVPTTAGRLQRLVQDNRLAPVAAAGDLVLFLRDAPGALELVTRGTPPPAGRAPIVFDGQLAFLGGALIDPAGRPGDTVGLYTCWQQADSIDRYFQTRFDVVNSAGRSVAAHQRDLGYLLWPPHLWTRGEPVRENYRLVLNDGLRPGVYHVVMRVMWRAQGSAGPSAPDDPSRYTFERGIDLGRLRVVPQ